MTTSAAGRIEFGGSGFGPDYMSVRRRKGRIEGEDDSSTSSSPRQFSRRQEEEFELFLFTVKDPIRSALGQLMSLIKDILEHHPEQPIPMPDVMNGPLGYTSVRAIRPMVFVPTKSVFRPIMR